MYVYWARQLHYQKEASGEGMNGDDQGPQRETQMLVLNRHIFDLPCTCTLNGALRTRNDWQVFFTPSTLPRPKHKASCLPFCCLATTTSLITRVFLSYLLGNWVHGATRKKAKAC